MGLVILLFMLFRIGIENLLNSLLNADLRWLLFAFTLLPLIFFIRAYRWRMLLLTSKNTLQYGNTLATIFLGYFANYIIPIRTGEVLRACLMRMREGVPFFAAFSSIIVERVLDLLSIVSIAILTFFIFSKDLSLSEWAVNSLRVVLLLVLSALTILIVSAKKESTVKSVMSSMLLKIPILESWRNRLNTWMNELIHGVRGLSYSLTALCILLFQSFAIWLLYSLQLYTMFKAFSINIPPSVALMGTMLFNLSFTMPAPPGYVGSYEVFWSVVFIGLGVSLAEALPVGLITHLLSAVFIIVMGCLSMVWFGLSLDTLTKRKLLREVSRGYE